MDQQQKIIVGGVAGVLILCVVAFLALISSYNPPQKAEPVYAVNPAVDKSQLTDDVRRSNPNSVVIESSEQSTEAVESLNQAKSKDAAKGDVQIIAMDYDNVPVSDLACQLSLVIQNTNFPYESMSLESESMTNSKGECYFYDLEPYKDYNVDFYKEKNGQLLHLEVVEVRNLQPGIAFREQIIIGTDLEIRNELASECYDTDGGYNADVFGSVFWWADGDGNQQETRDKCISTSMLMEAVCDSDGFANNSKTYNCPNGCQDGACIN